MNILIQLLLAVVVILIISKIFKSTTLFRKLTFVLAISVILGAAIRTHISDSKDKSSVESAVVMDDDGSNPTPVLFDLVTNFVELQSSYGLKHNYFITTDGKESQRQQQPTIANGRASPEAENSS